MRASSFRQSVESSAPSRRRDAAVRGFCLGVAMLVCFSSRSPFPTPPVLLVHEHADTLRLFPLPARKRPETGIRSRTLRRACSVAAPNGVPLPKGRRLGPGVIVDAPTDSGRQRERTSRRRERPRRREIVECPPGRLAPMRDRRHQQPLAGPGRGAEAPWVGAVSRRPVRRVR